MKRIAASLGVVLALGLACSGPTEEPPLQGIDDRATQDPEVTAERIGADETCVRYCEALAACDAAEQDCVDACTVLAESAEGADQIRCVMDAEGCTARLACVEEEGEAD